MSSVVKAHYDEWAVPVLVGQRERIAHILYDQGAYCGLCDFEGWDTCNECQRVLYGYADTVMSELQVIDLTAHETVEKATEAGWESTLPLYWLNDDAAEPHPVPSWEHADEDDKQHARKMMRTALAALIPDLNGSGR